MLRERGRENWGCTALDDSTGTLTRFHVLPDRSALLVKARSNVGPINFGSTDLSGVVVAEVCDGQLVGIERTCAHLEIPVASLASGNAIYDAEVQRRVDARRYPTICVELTNATAVADSDRFLLSANVILRDIVLDLTGAVSVELTGPNSLVVTGNHALDIRDFRIEVPSTMLLKIYPEILIEMHLEATAAA